MRSFFTLILCVFVVHFSFAQDIRYEIVPTYRKSIKKDIVNNAKSIIDINPEFPTSWVEVYHQIDLIITTNKISKTVTAVADDLSSNQIEMLAQSDIASEVELNIKYTPKNSKEVRNIKFAYTVIPEREAKYIGEQDIDAYLKSAVVDKLTSEIISNIELVKVKFTVDEAGKLINPVLDSSTNNKRADTLLIDAIKQMPQWSPARKSDGRFVSQDFELVFGMLAGC